MGVDSQLCTPHEQYLLLGNTKQERQASYRQLFQAVLSENLIEEIRQASNKGMAIGSENFKLQIEALTGRRLHSVKMGRPIGWRKKKDGI